MHWIVLLALTALPASALTAARTLPAGTVLAAADIIADVDEARHAVGLQTRMTVYEGRPINPAQLRPPLLIDRNDLVTVRFHKGGIDITTEARALEPGAAGQRIRLMNLTSRNTISGYVTADGSVSTNPPEDRK